MWQCVARAGGILVLFIASVGQGVAADAWPSKPVAIVVPFVAGGSTDVTARMLAGKLHAELGQTFVVDNRGGAGGNVGGEYAAKANADGYTMFLATSSNITNMSLYKNVSYDMVRDFVAVTRVAFIPNLLVVHNSVPTKNLGEFIKYIQQPQSKVDYGSAGTGSSLHLAGALFDKLAKGHMTHVPYKGSAPAIVDLLGGHIQAAFPPFVDALPHVKAGKLRALGITTKGRSAVLPDVPAIGEVLPGYEVALWNGLFLPSKTAPDIVGKLNEAVNKILRQPDTRKLLAEQGSEPAGTSLAEFKDFVGREMQKWRTLVELSGARLD